MLGSGKTRLRWSEGLRALGHEVDVFEPRHFEWLHGARRALRFRQALGAVGFVRAQLGKRHYDLVEFFGGEFGLATERLSRERRRPFIIAHTDGFKLLASERERELTLLPYKWRPFAAVVPTTDPRSTFPCGFRQCRCVCHRLRTRSPAGDRDATISAEPHRCYFPWPRRTSIFRSRHLRRSYESPLPDPGYRARAWDTSSR
jgi:hypothetical protein